MDKSQIRKLMIKKRLDLGEDEYLTKSNLIIYKLKQHPCFIKARTIGIYVSYKNEVETINLIKDIVKSKKICVPKVNDQSMDFCLIRSLDELKPGNYGILEPVSNKVIEKNNIDLLVVPIVAYDNMHNRLGYGGGYYDRYLQGYCGNVIGLAFSFQKVAVLPIENFDLPIDVIIDEN